MDSEANMGIQLRSVFLLLWALLTKQLRSLVTETIKASKVQGLLYTCYARAYVKTAIQMPSLMKTDSPQG